jgi:hypothetical protein
VSPARPSEARAGTPGADAGAERAPVVGGGPGARSDDRLADRLGEGSVRAIVTTTYRYKRPPRKRKAAALDLIPASCSSCAWQADKKLLADLMVLQKHRSGVLNPGADMRIYDNR